MTRSSTVGIILAAGKSTRFKGDKPKFLHLLLGRPVIDYVTQAIKPFVNTIIYVSSPEYPVHPEAIIQKEALGTGDAVKVALPYVKEERLLIAFGDTPLVSQTTIKNLLAQQTDMTIAVFKTKDITQRYGRFDPASKKIIQYKDATDTQKANPLCHAGIMVVKREVLANLLPHVSNNNEAKEYYLTDVVNMFEGKIGVVEGSEEEFIGIDTRENLSQACEILNKWLIKQHMDNGVTFDDPNTTRLSYDTQIGLDTQISPHVVMGPNVSIGSKTRILPFCHLEDCTIKDNCIVGPFAHIRSKSILDDGAEIGNFVEVKNTTVGRKSKAKHHAYLGDTIMRSNVNIGAGTITCNYNGQTKSQTIIHDGAFIGSNVNLIAPITVGENAYIAAGSTVGRDVEPNTFVIERSDDKRKPVCTKK